MAIDMTERKKAEGKIREQAALLDKAQDAHHRLQHGSKHRILEPGRRTDLWRGARRRSSLAKNVRQSCFFTKKIPTECLGPGKELDKHGEWVGELSEFTKNERSVIVQARATLIRDEGGAPKSLLIINTDITERKQLEEQFLRAQRLESLGALVGGIAHDLNNALVPIIVGVDIMRQQPLSADAQSMIRTMESSARRSAEMVKQMLVFARGGETEKTVVYVNRLLKEMGRIVSDTFPKTIRYSQITRRKKSFGRSRVFPSSFTRSCSTCVSMRATRCPRAARSP